MPGRLCGLGVGPGDPELITVKALRLLRAAPVVAYPAPEGGDSFARAIVAPWLAGHQREIALPFPMRPGPPPAAVYDSAAAALAGELDHGRDVALLCQGDPLLYGSFLGLYERLCRRYEIAIVPGVSSATAGAAAAGLPLVSGEDSLAVIPATLDEEALARRLAASEAAVVVKLGRHFAKLRRVLERLDLLDRTVYVERASLPNQRVLPLASVDPASVPYFSLALVRRR